MTRKNPRRIHVDGRDYRWTVRPLDAAHVVVRVWLDRPGRRGQVLAVTRRFDDPWLHYGVLLTAPPERIAEIFQLEPVTPQLTADLVRAGLAAGWQPQEPGGELRLTASTPLVGDAHAAGVRLSPLPGAAPSGEGRRFRTLSPDN